MLLFDVHQRFKVQFLNELRVSFKKKRDIFSNVTIKIHNEVNWLLSDIFIIDFEQTDKYQGRWWFFNQVKDTPVDVFLRTRFL